MVLTATYDEHIKPAVVRGYRPPLDAITGPGDLVSFAVHCISLCWHRLSDQRPSFHGQFCIFLFMLQKSDNQSVNQTISMALKF